MDQARALIVVSDETVLDEVLRLAAAGVRGPERSGPARGARPVGQAPLVVIDEDDARSGVILPHRGGVVLVGKGPPEPSTCESAFAAGVERVASLPDEEAS